MPEDIVEHASITLGTVADEQVRMERLNAPTQLNGYAQGVGGMMGMDEDDEGVEETKGGDGSVDDDATLTSEMLTDLARWNDSNHECLLFNNQSHKFSFLSLDPGKFGIGTSCAPSLSKTD